MPKDRTSQSNQSFGVNEDLFITFTESGVELIQTHTWPDGKIQKVVINDQIDAEIIVNKIKERFDI